MSIMYAKGIRLIDLTEFRKRYSVALERWMEDQQFLGLYILRNGIPRLDEDNISTFIKWAFLKLEPDLPEKYFLVTPKATWAISGADAIIWDLGAFDNESD